MYGHVRNKRQLLISYEECSTFTGRVYLLCNVEDALRHDARSQRIGTAYTGFYVDGC